MENSKKHIKRSLRFSLTLVAIIWLIHTYKYFSGTSLSYFGIYPREIRGIIGIFTSPFIHGDWGHLLSNSAPLFLLSFTISYFYRSIVAYSFTTIYLLTGILVWFLARPVYHIGASGVVYGLVSFVFWTGIFRRSLISIVLSLSVLVLYSGYFAGIFPFKEGVSFESHLLGGIVGIIVAWMFKGLIEEEEKEKPNPWEYEKNQAAVYFLNRDTFDLTKQERQIRQEELRRRQSEQGPEFF